MHSNQFTKPVPVGNAIVGPYGAVVTRLTRTYPLRIIERYEKILGSTPSAGNIFWTCDVPNQTVFGELEDFTHFALTESNFSVRCQRDSQPCRQAVCV